MVPALTEIRTWFEFVLGFAFWRFDFDGFRALFFILFFCFSSFVHPFSLLGVSHVSAEAGEMAQSKG